MTGPGPSQGARPLSAAKHYGEAERLVESAQQLLETPYQGRASEATEQARALLAQAQVHATLAVYVAIVTTRPR
jgi:hypothetical protein